MSKISITMQIWYPAFIEKMFVWFLLRWREKQYGYGFRRIKLTQGKCAIVDAEDFERLNKYKWQAVKIGCCFYAKRSKRDKNKITAVQMHREIMRPPKELLIDHKNHNGLDNRKANLRFATALQNSWNTIRAERKGRPRYKGVRYHKTYKKWYVILYNNGRKIRIGYFDDEIEAARAYDETIKRYRGEFAVLNFEDS